MNRFGFDSYNFTDVGRRETVNSLESEKQDLEFTTVKYVLSGPHIKRTPCIKRTPA